MRGQGALIVFAALAAGTGAYGADAPKVAELDACSLIVPADVAAVTGGTIAKSERDDSGETNEGGGYSSTCIWKIDGLAKVPAVKEGAPEPFGGQAFAMLNTIVWPAGSGLAKKYVNDFRDAAKQDLIDATPVPVKAGDDALFWGDGVAVAKGDISFGVSVHVGIDKKAEQAMEEALAQKIVPRL